LVRHVHLDLATVAARKSAWESRDWYKASFETRTAEQRFFGGYGHLPYHVQIQQYLNSKKASDPKVSQSEFTDADVVPAILQDLNSEDKDLIMNVASDRKNWPEFPAPRVVSIPPPRLPREVDPNTERRAQVALLRAWQKRVIARRMAHNVSGRTQLAGINIAIWDADEVADAFVERKRAERASHNPRGAARGSPALGSRRMRCVHIMQASKKDAPPKSANPAPHSGAGGKHHRARSPRACSHEPMARKSALAKRADQLQFSDAAKKRQVSRQRARDAKFGCCLPARP